MALNRKGESEENGGSENLEDETSITEETDTPAKRKRGRPRKSESGKKQTAITETDTPATKKRGRPRKLESEKKQKIPSGRARGRPRIYPVGEKKPKRPRGRPRTSTKAERIIREKQRRGRPRILPFGSLNKRPKRNVGRPRKFFSTENGEALIQRVNKGSYTHSLASQGSVPSQQNGSPVLPVVSQVVPQNVGRSRISLTAYHLVEHRNTTRVGLQSELDMAIRKQFSADCDDGLELLKKRFLAVSTQLIECEEDKLKLEKCMIIIKQKKLQLHSQFPAWRANSLDLLKRKLLTMNAQLTEYEEQKLELEKRMIIIKQRKLQLERDILSYKPSVALDVGTTTSASANSDISVIVDNQALGSLPLTMPRCEVVLEKVAVENSVEQSENSSASTPKKRGRPRLKPSGDSTDDQQDDGVPVRKRGRPRLDASSKKVKKVTNRGDLGPKRGRGRPRKLKMPATPATTVFSEESSGESVEVSSE